mmetsp:Transcript_24650/g.45170  ORF Transcript_24650/g.45170 Transcript_24650/m.45170 type:complete len:348 (+) Transcript_24650:82-1125(+)
MSTLAPASPSGILACAALYLCPKDGLPVLHCCNGLQRAVPLCLSPKTSWLWIPKNLERVSLGQLCDKDADLCQCLQAATTSTFSIEYEHKFREKFVITAKGSSAVQGGATTDEVSADLPNIVVERSLPELIEMTDLWECLELGSRIVSMPEELLNDIIPTVVVGSPVSGADSPTLASLGLDGWIYKGMVKSQKERSWPRMTFEHPHPYCPLAFFYVEASFDLPGGDGGVDSVLGFITTDLKYVLTSRRLSEFPVWRFFGTSSYQRWLDVPPPTADLPNTTALSQHLQRESSNPEEIRVKGTVGGWDVEISTGYKLPGSERYLIDSPALLGAYTDAESLCNSYKARFS